MQCNTIPCLDKCRHNSEDKKHSRENSLFHHHSTYQMFTPSITRLQWLSNIYRMHSNYSPRHNSPCPPKTTTYAIKKYKNRSWVATSSPTAFAPTCLGTICFFIINGSKPWDSICNYTGRIPLPGELSSAWKWLIMSSQRQLEMDNKCWPFQQVSNK